MDARRSSVEKNDKKNILLQITLTLNPCKWSMQLHILVNALVLYAATQSIYLKPVIILRTERV